jgi:hypothetical protein
MSQRAVSDILLAVHIINSNGLCGTHEWWILGRHARMWLWNVNAEDTILAFFVGRIMESQCGIKSRTLNVWSGIQVSCKTFTVKGEFVSSKIILIWLFWNRSITQLFGGNDLDTSVWVSQFEAPGSVPHNYLCWIKWLWNCTYSVGFPSVVFLKQVFGIWLSVEMMKWRWDWLNM